MAGNITLTMIKPTAVKKGYTGSILAQINNAGFTIIAMRYTKLSMSQAEQFYLVHRERPFYRDLVNFMSSGPIVAAILLKEDAVNEYRKLIGNTNPELAEEGSIRKLYGQTIQ